MAGQAQRPGDRPRQEFGMVLAALPLAQAMLRDGHNHVYFVQGRVPRRDTHELGGKPCAERKHLVVLQ